MLWLRDIAMEGGTLVDSVARGLHGRGAELRRRGENRKEGSVAQDRRKGAPLERPACGDEIQHLPAQKRQGAEVTDTTRKKKTPPQLIALRSNPTNL